MHFELSTVLTIVLEGALFAYYADTVFYPRRNTFTSRLISICGYGILLFVALLFNPTLNVASFIIINFAIIYTGFHTGIKSAAVHTITLTVFMMLADFFMAFFIDYQIKSMSLLTLTKEETMLQMLGSKSMYLVFIIILKNIINERELYKEGKSGRAGLMIMPVSSMTFMLVIMQIMPVLGIRQKRMLILLGLFITISNIVVFWIYDNTLKQSAKLHALQDMSHKNEMDLENYKRIKQKYEQTRIIRHDMKEHLGILETLIKENPEKAITYLHCMIPQTPGSGLVEVSNSKIFNVLISQKMETCKQLGICFDIIHHSMIDMSFISDIDIVSIFSNLLKNAIESSQNSQEKYITMEFFKKNSFFLVTLKNAADHRPVYEDNILKTSKKNKSIHGIGMRSINDAVQKYNGYMDWSYSDETHSFETIIGLRMAGGQTRLAAVPVASIKNI